MPEMAQVCNPTLATILSHNSMLGYLPHALPSGTLELLISAAQSASTLSNLQIWSVVALQDTERKARHPARSGMPPCGNKASA